MGINVEIVYELESDVNGKFRIDLDFGFVIMLEILEKENVENEFIIVVKVINRRVGGDLLKFGIVFVIIKVIDGND